MDRRGFLGGSDMPIVMGVSTYMTRFMLWQLKRGEIAPPPKTESQECGHLFEAAIAAGYEERYSVALEKPTASFQHARLPFLRAQVDRVRRAANGERAIVEIKNVSEWAADTFGKPGSDEIPRDYYVQLQTQFACTGFSEPAHLFAAFGGNRMRLYVVERNDEAVAAIEESAERFWQLIQSGTAPGFADADAASIRFPESETGRKVVATPEVLSLYARLSKAEAIRNRGGASFDDAKEQVKRFMETAEILVDGGGKVLVTWKRTAKGTRHFLPKAS